MFVYHFLLPLIQRRYPRRAVMEFDREFILSRLQNAAQAGIPAVCHKSIPNTAAPEHRVSDSHYENHAIQNVYSCENSYATVTHMT